MPTSTKKRAGRPPLLSPDDVAAAVVEVGFDDFTVGKVAARLGVDYSTIYRYAPHRNGLVALGLDRLLRLDGMVLYNADDEHLGWRELLEQAAWRVWRFFDRHPGVAKEMARVTYPVRVFELATSLAEALVQRGFRPDDAVLAMDLALDLAVNTRSGAEHLDAVEASTKKSARPQVSERIHHASLRPVAQAFARMVAMPPETLFERLLAVVLAGIEHDLAPRCGAPRA